MSAATGAYAVPLIQAMRVQEAVVRQSASASIALALSGRRKTSKMFQGHRGANPSGQSGSPTQGSSHSNDHGFAVERDGLPANARETMCPCSTTALRLRAHAPARHSSVQYHPEPGPGPAGQFFTCSRNSSGRCGMGCRGHLAADATSAVVAQPSGSVSTAEQFEFARTKVGRFEIRGTTNSPLAGPRSVSGQSDVHLANNGDLRFFVGDDSQLQSVRFAFRGFARAPTAEREEATFAGRYAGVFLSMAKRLRVRNIPRTSRKFVNPLISRPEIILPVVARISGRFVRRLPSPL